jgi:hypothetical protein
MLRRWHHLRILCTRSMLTVLFLASCATTQTTPLQDYTYEMGRYCETPTTKIERVAPNGRYWILARGDAGVGSTEYPKFHACMKAQYKAHPYFDWLKANRGDWIDHTLVTETAAGTWKGAMTTATASPSVRNEIRFELEQTGPSVKGSFQGQLYGIAPVTTVLIEGSMAGDVFKFRDARGTLTGDLTVSGDDMTGRGVVGNNRQVVFRLRRIDSGAPPR